VARDAIGPSSVLQLPKSAARQTKINMPRICRRRRQRHSSARRGAAADQLPGASVPAAGPARVPLHRVSLFFPHEGSTERIRNLRTLHGQWSCHRFYPPMTQLLPLRRYTWPGPGLAAANADVQRFATIGIFVIQARRMCSASKSYVRCTPAPMGRG